MVLMYLQRKRRKGFIHYNAMHDIMPNRVKGKHAFCASMQSHGAAALNLSSRKGKGKGKDISSSNDELVAITKPSASTMGPIPIPSSASASSSKHKYSALGEDESAVSGSHTSYSSGK